MQDADTEKLSTLGSFSALQSEANRLRDIDHRYAELKAEFDALKKEVCSLFSIIDMLHVCYQLLSHI